MLAAHQWVAVAAIVVAFAAAVWGFVAWRRRAEPGAVGEYRSGKRQVYGYLVGRVMAHMNGRADARLVNEELRRRLDAVPDG